MAVDGFSAFVSTLPSAARRGLLELKRLINALTERVTTLETFKTNAEGAWTTYTPTFAQGASSNISKTVQYSKYRQIGKTVYFQFAVKFTAGGTAASPVTATLPVTAAGINGQIVGTSEYYDSSASNRYNGGVELSSSGTKVLMTTHEGEFDGWGASPSVAVANDDDFRMAIVYEAA